MARTLRFIRKFFALLLLTFSLIYPATAETQPAFRVLTLFHRPVARVDAVLGKPVAVRAISNIQYRTYRIVQGSVEVRFKEGKASAFQFWLKRPQSDPVRAVELIGIKMGGRKATVNGLYRKAWRGNLGHPALKELSATNLSLHGYDLIVAKDYL
jgi:hypothetical protein